MNASIVTHVMRRTAAGIGVVAVLALTSACSSAAPEPSPSASPSSSPSPSIASDVPLEEQLFDALRAGDVDLTTALLEAGADVDAPLPNESTAIGIAVVRNEPGLVAAVLTADPDLAVVNADGLPLLNAACFQGVSGEVMELLLDAGAQSDSVSPDDVGSLPIHECAYSGSSDAIDALIEHGVDVNARQAIYEGTALIVAAWQGDVDLVHHLLDLGADPTLTTNDGTTASKWARVGGDQDLANLLVTLGG